MAQGDSWSLGVAIDVKNNQFTFGQNKSLKLNSAINTLTSLEASYGLTTYPDILHHLQYGDSILLGPSSQDDYRGENEYLRVSGAYNYDVNNNRIIFSQKSNKNKYNSGDNISFYGTGLAGGWIVNDSNIVLAQGIKTGPVSHQKVNTSTGFSVGSTGGKYYIVAPLGEISDFDYGIGLDMISQDLVYVKTPITSGGNMEFATVGVPGSSYRLLIGDWHRGGWRKEFAQRLRLSIQDDSVSGTLFYQKLLRYLTSNNPVDDGLLIPYQYYRFGGRVYIDLSHTTLTVNNWTLKLHLQMHDNDVLSTESLSVPLFTSSSDVNKWYEFSTTGLLKSGVNRNSSPSLSLKFTNDGIDPPSGSQYGDVILYIDELWIEHGGGVNNAHIDGCLDFGRYFVWPEQGTIEFQTLSNKSGLYGSSDKHIIKARFNYVSQDFWDQLEILLHWQKRGYCLNLHTNLNDYPYVMRGKIYITELKKDSWDLTSRSFILEFVEE